MGKISRIQLRGISRTPSDRMTEDGGCAESLNVSLDHSELAPSFIPEDVTKSLGLPDDLQAEKVFVHKTANYENFITIKDGILKAFNKDSSLISTFPIKGKVNDVVSLGNTLLVLTDVSTNYVLFEGGQYVNLGTDIPFPKLHVQANGAGGQKSVTIDLDEIGVPGMYRSFSSDLYGTYLNNGQNSDENVKKILSVIGNQKAVIAGELGRQGLFWGPVYVMYGITLYNGTVITTVPELLLRKDIALPRVWGLTLESKFEMNGLNKEFIGDIEAKIEAPAFSLNVSCEEDYDIADWKDLIHSVDVYVTLPIDTAPDYRRIEVTDVSDTDSTTSSTQTRTASVNWGILEERAQILGTGNFYRIKSYELLQDDENGVVSKFSFKWNSSDFDMTGEALSTSPYQLPSSDVDHIYVDALSVVAKSGILFNEHVLLTSAANLITYRGQAATATASNNMVRYTARLKFTLSDGGVVYSDPDIQLPSSGILTFANTKAVSVEMAIVRKRQIYTDQDGTDYDIETTYSYLALPMKPHLSMPCSYAYLGIGESFEEYAFEKNGVLTIEELQDKIDFNTDAPHSLSLENKVLVSSASNPFVYPETKRVTFQSKVLGVAIATTTLSQGQFGQFPLAVFTEDGLWMARVNDEGAIVGTSPKTRDVCVNPKSITAINDAIVFVTAQGVMMLQDAMDVNMARVVNISPNMNGRHYTIEETAKVILEKTIEDTIAKIGKTPVDQMAQVIQNEVGQSISQQETRASIERTAQSIIAEEEFFKDLLPILSDSTHFMAFVREATIAYDYPGQRLVFIKKDEKYQYVYKLDTQTWHKTAYGIDLFAPVNSYPECLVQGQKKKEVTRTFWKVVEYNSQEEFDYLAGRIRVIMPELSDREIQYFLDMDGVIDVTGIHEDDQEWLANEMDTYHVATEFEEKTGEESFTCIYDLSTILDAADSRIPTRGVIATRPFDLGAPDVLKTITDIKIRGQYARGAVKFMLLGSMDGINFYVIGTKRGKAWKLFRLIILADLDPTERISWVDVIYDEKFTNRLR